MQSPPLCAITTRTRIRGRYNIQVGYCFCCFLAVLDGKAVVKHSYRHFIVANVIAHQTKKFVGFSQKSRFDAQHLLFTCIHKRRCQHISVANIIAIVIMFLDHFNISTGSVGDI